MKQRASLLLAWVIASASIAKASAPHQAAAQIDAILQADWQQNKLKGNPAADDNTFVRRIYLDVIGRIPTTRETEEFLSDSSKDKRAKLIDKLLDSEGHVQHSFNYWADVLRVTSNGQQTGSITGAAYMNFVKQSLRENKHFDDMVKEMVAAQGKAWENGAIGYYMRDRGMPLDNMANTVRVFLGTRIECAQCHNHPFDKWSQMQFYKMASFTYGVQAQDYYGGRVGEVRDMLKEQATQGTLAIKEPQRPQRPNPPRIKGKMTPEEQAKLRAEFTTAQKKYEADIKAYDVAMKEVNLKRREAQEKYRRDQRSLQEGMNDIRDTMRYTSVSFEENRKPQLPHDYQYTDAKPKERIEPGTMMGHEANCLPGETPLEAYARWMASPENPRFTTVITNRLWKRAFGLALIEPLDELMDTSVPMVPAMQKHLEKLMVDLDYDMKSFLRVLYNTKTYQSQVTQQEVAPGTVYHFTGPLLRRMTPEQMWDSFVTLINPSPDMINVRNREDMEQRILQAKKNADSIEALTADQLLAGLKAAAEVYDRNMERTKDVGVRYAEARTKAKEAQTKADAMKAGPERDKALADAKELKAKSDTVRSEANKLQNEGRQVTYREVLAKGSKALYEKVTGKPYELASLKEPAKEGEASPAMMSGGEMMMMGNGARIERIRIPGYDRKELTKEERQAEQTLRETTYREEAKFFGITEEKQIRKYIAQRSNVSQRYLRSAELESPAPRGHYLREFGQSDRETIENSNIEASVPQALAMMNGELLPIITNESSQLMLTIRKAQYPDDKVSAAYMTLLSRMPTEKEKATWLKAQDAGLTDMNDLIFSLLNTQQFIFVQ